LPTTHSQRPTTALRKLLQKPDVPLKEQLQIIEAVLQHRNSIYAHSKRKAGNFLLIVAVVLHELEDVRIHHAAPENFNPSGLLARAARRVFMAAFAAPAADEAGDEHLRARLGEREERWTKAGFHV